MKQMKTVKEGFIVLVPNCFVLGEGECISIEEQEEDERLFTRLVIEVFEMANHWSKELPDEWRRFLHRDNALEMAKVFICWKYFKDDDVLLHLDIPMVQ
ncbi:hypothetical protein LOD99_5058 [Oopsacas minuta]|uniref:Uncharacterized protein n=1 Tax=Oopsacas minuta TaxID=111878 RepID=A0AAV7JSW7_9METZ|nr:hypothetical protein LOD99_5058 [Oopsacas minuta]